MISFKLALRTLKRFKLYTVINATSLILCLVCVLSLSRYIYREYTINSELPDHERVFFTMWNNLVTQPDAPGVPVLQCSSPAFNGPSELVSSVYNNEKIIRKCTISSPESTDEPQLQEGMPRLGTQKVLYADSVFFEMVRYEALHGTLKLKGENDALIMSDVARKIFGTTDVIGRTWLTQENQMKTITGVIERPHCKTTFDFDIVYNIRTRQNRFDNRGLVQLHRAEDSTFINNEFSKTFEKRLQEFKGDGGFTAIFREHLLSIDNYTQLFSINSRQLHLYLVLVVIFFVIGAFNYLNLHSVIMHRRKRDIQIKTIFGASKKCILSELFMEHLIILTTVMPLVWLLVYLTRNQLNELFNIPLESDIRFDLGITIALPWVLGSLFTLISFVQIRRQATESDTQSAVPAARSSSYARIAYLFVQYMMTFCLIVFALYQNHHVYYLFYNDRGYRSENVLYFNINSKSSLSKDNALTYDMQNVNRAFRKEDVAREFERNILSSPLFEGVTFGERPYDQYRDNQFVTEEGKVIKASSHHATHEWMNFFKLHFVHGRNWTDKEQNQVKGGINDDAPLNPNEPFKVIVNEALWNELTPEQQQKPFLMDKKGNFGPTNDAIMVDVVGVVQDYSLWKLTNKAEPLIFYLENEKGYYSKLLFAAVKPGKEEEAVQFLKQLHQRLCPEGSFDCKWLDDDLYDRHQEDFKAAKSISAFAILSIFISCLGLFGLSLYDIRSRYREIALRKINGAHNKDIYYILFRKYALTLIGAALVATPFSYWGVMEYMKAVENRAPITIWIFLGALVLLALVSMMTLLVQVRRAVHLNAQEVMKTE